MIRFDFFAVGLIKKKNDRLNNNQFFRFAYDDCYRRNGWLPINVNNISYPGNKKATANFGGFLAQEIMLSIILCCWPEHHRCAVDLRTAF